MGRQKNGYKDLIVWQKAMDLVVEVYKVVKLLPREELYALSDQIRRAAVSIPSNIAEGYMRGSTKEYSHFLKIANGSCAEVETQLEIARRLGYVEVQKLEIANGLLVEVGKMLTSIVKTLDSGL